MNQYFPSKEDALNFAKRWNKGSDVSFTVKHINVDKLDIKFYSHPCNVSVLREDHQNYDPKDKGGILILSVSRGNEINIEYSKKEIINKVNSYFGYKLINEIRLKTYNSISVKKVKKNNKNEFTKNFKDKINKIENEDLKSSLLQLLSLAKK